MAIAQHMPKEGRGHPVLVRLAGPEVATDTVLPTLAAALRGSDSGISVVVNICDEADGFARLARGEVDVYLYAYLTTPPAEDLGWVELLHDEIVVVMGADDPMTKAVRVPLQHVLNRHIVGGPLYSGTFRTDMMELVAAHGKPMVVYETPSYASSFAFVAAGQAISIHFKRMLPPFERSHVVSRPLVEPIVVTWGTAFRKDSDPVLMWALTKVAEGFGGRSAAGGSVRV